MAYFTSIFVAVAFYLSIFTTVTSSPTFNSKVGKSFSLPVAHDAEIPRHGPSEYLKVLKKYKLDVPQGLQDVVDSHNAKVQSSKVVAGEVGKLKQTISQLISSSAANDNTRRFRSGSFTRW